MRRIESACENIGTVLGFPTNNLKLSVNTIAAKYEEGPLANRTVPQRAQAETEDQYFRQF